MWFQAVSDVNIGLELRISGEALADGHHLVHEVAPNVVVGTP